MCHKTDGLRAKAVRAAHAKLSGDSQMYMMTGCPRDEKIIFYAGETYLTLFEVHTNRHFARRYKNNKGVALMSLHRAIWKFVGVFHGICVYRLAEK